MGKLPGIGDQNSGPSREHGCYDDAGVRHDDDASADKAIHKALGTQCLQSVPTGARIQGFVALPVAEELIKGTQLVDGKVGATNGDGIDRVAGDQLRRREAGSRRRDRREVEVNDFFRRSVSERKRASARLRGDSDYVKQTDRST